MRQSLFDIRKGRTERLTVSFTKEVSPLAEELNGMLDQTTEVLGRARSHVGNLAHALKTPLAVLGNESASPTEKIPDIVDEQTQLMRRHVDHHLVRARAMGQAPLLRGQTALLPVMELLSRLLRLRTCCFAASSTIVRKCTEIWLITPANGPKEKFHFRLRHCPKLVVAGSKFVCKSMMTGQVFRRRNVRKYLGVAGAPTKRHRAVVLSL
jgi:signal transduction histidine kinase